MAARLTAVQRDQAVNLYASGKTLREAAAIVGCHLETVRKHVKRAGVLVRPLGKHYARSNA